MDVYQDTAARAVSREATETLEKYRGMKITCHNEYVAASDILKDIKSRGRKLEELRRSMTKPLDDSKAKIMDFFRAPTDALAAAEKSVKAAMLKFSQEQERERLAEVARERERRQADMDKAAEAAMFAAESGDVDKAEEIINQAAAMPVVTVPVAPKVAGIGSRKVWKWRLVDYSLVPREYLKLDEVMLTKAVVVSQGKIVIPGIDVYCEEIVTSRGI